MKEINLDGQHYSDRQFEAINGLIELFLSVPLQEITYLDSDPEYKDRLQREELAGLNSQFEQLVEITNRCGDMSPWFLRRLFIDLQNKAQSEIAVRNVLAGTTDPERLTEYGVPEHLIKHVVKVRDYLRELRPKKYQEASAKGGRKRTKQAKKTMRFTDTGGINGKPTQRYTAT